MGTVFGKWGGELIIITFSIQFGPFNIIALLSGSHLML